MYRKKRLVSLPIIYDGLIYCIPLLILAGLTSIWSVYASFFWVLPAGFVLFFFRNPIRKSNADENSVISPADGVVMFTGEVDEPDFFEGKCLKVTIFLSVFNVHVNRAPVAGKVIYHNYREGAMIPAFKSHASDINERNSVGFENSDGKKFMVRQITGFIARRIVWWVNLGDELSRGERFGLIKFGSCTEIFMPIGCKILVKSGDKVRGGKTILASISRDEIK